MRRDAILLAGDPSRLRLRFFGAPRLGWLDDRLTAMGSARRSIDPDRRFLFGYSNGGMMAYRLAADVPDYFRAMWVYATSYGGKALHGHTPLVENVPPVSAGPISVFHVHGGADQTVDPGPDGDTTALTVSQAAEAVMNAQGVNPPGSFARSDRSLSGAMLAYRTHNGLAAVPYRDLTGLPSVGPVDNSFRREWRNTAGDPFPSVVLYRDPALEHIGLATASYVSEVLVWDWFKTQGP